MDSKLRPETLCIQAGYTPKNGEPRQIPIVQSTTFKYDTSEDMGKLFDLEAERLFLLPAWQIPPTTRWPPRSAALEGGTAAMLTASGQAANFLAVFNIARLRRSHRLPPPPSTAARFNLFSVTMKRMGMEITFVDPRLHRRGAGRRLPPQHQGACSARPSPTPP